MRALVFVVVLVASCSDDNHHRWQPPGDFAPPGGSSVPQRGMGDRCSDASECQNNLCLDITDDPLPPFCSGECQGTCPAGMACRLTTAGISVCGFDTPPTAMALGAPCRFDVDCASGLCLGVSGDKRCTRYCHVHACPGDFSCLALEDGTSICFPVADGGQSVGPAVGSAAVGDGCAADADCASGLCTRSQTGPYCTQSCRGDTDCPSGMTCNDLADLGPGCTLAGR
jgi:hypothetical protein